MLICKSFHFKDKTFKTEHIIWYRPKNKPTDGCNAYLTINVVELYCIVLFFFSFFFNFQLFRKFIFVFRGRKTKMYKIKRKGKKKKENQFDGMQGMCYDAVERDSFTMRARVKERERVAEWRSSLPFSRPRRGSDWPRSSLARVTTPPLQVPNGEESAVLTRPRQQPAKTPKCNVQVANLFSWSPTRLERRRQCSNAHPRFKLRRTTKPKI